MAATWNLPLVFQMGVVASDESWALQNRANASSAPTDYRSGASSVINILRDGVRVLPPSSDQLLRRAAVVR